jgi:hypothetical protein|eukprot:COSAG02_NODE_5100_length_4629_cov_87.536424_5_plen_319_part_00
MYCVDCCSQFLFAGSGSSDQQGAVRRERRFSSPPPRNGPAPADGSPSRQTQWAPQLDSSSGSLAPSSAGPISPSSTRQLQQEPTASRQSDSDQDGQEVSSISVGEVRQFLHDLRDDISAVHTTAEVAARAASLAARGVAQSVANTPGAPDPHLDSSSLVQEQQHALDSLRAEVTRMQGAMQAHEQSVADSAAETTDQPHAARQYHPKQRQTDRCYHSSEQHAHNGASEKHSPALRRVDDEWKEGYDTVRGKTYWYNLHTKETRWQHDTPRASAYRHGGDRTPTRGKRADTKQARDRGGVGDTFVAPEFRADTGTAFAP